jgi:hypothetical protein
MAGYSASEIGKRESSICLGARQLSLVRVGEQDTDEDSPLAGEFNGDFNGGEDSQTNGFKHTIESSILTDLTFRKSA